MVPKKRHSKSKVGRRRANLALKRENIHVCSSCRGPRMPHKACPQCGFYNGKKTLKAKALK